jgi:uncharacterized protein YjiS (DUF1127 family)
MITDRIWNGAFSDRDRAALPQSLWARVDMALGNLVTTMLVWQDRARQRRALLGLDDQALHDFGVSRAEATSKGDKPFWLP